MQGERIAQRIDQQEGRSVPHRCEGVRETEPVLRRGATHVLDATRPLQEVVDEVERIGRGET